MRRFGPKSHKVTKLEIVALVGLVVLVGAAVVYKSFAGSNAMYVPKSVTALSGTGRSIQVNSAMTGGYTMDVHGQLYAFSVGTGTLPYALPVGDYHSVGDNARDFVVLDWANPSVLVLSNDGVLHAVASSRAIVQEPFTTLTARKIIMYDGLRGYVLDGSGRFTGFAVDGAALPPKISGFAVQSGQDVARSAILNPNKQNGYLVTADGNIHELRVGSGAAPVAITGGTVWPGVNKAVDITMSSWSSSQGYVIASDGGWYAFNGAPNDYNGKSGAPFDFGTNIKGFDLVAGKAGFEVSKDGTVYVFSLPNFLVAQNNKEIYPPSDTSSFNIGTPLAYGYYRMPSAPNGEYDFYNPNVSPFNTQPTPDTDGTMASERCGGPELLKMTYKVAVQWQTKYGGDGSRINVGDMNASGHISHRNGVDVDIRTSNNSAANVPNAARYTYLRDRSIQLAKWLIDDGAKLILYNDTAIYSAVNTYGRSKGLNYDVMQYYDYHNEHMHVRIGSKSISGNPLNLTATNGCP